MIRSFLFSINLSCVLIVTVRKKRISSIKVSTSFPDPLLETFSLIKSCQKCGLRIKKLAPGRMFVQPERTENLSGHRAASFMYAQPRTLLECKDEAKAYRSAWESVSNPTSHRGPGKKCDESFGVGLTANVLANHGPVCGRELTW